MDVNLIERYKPYTDEEYCSPSRIRTLIGSNFIDPVLDKVNAYRKEYRVDLPLKRLTSRNPLFYTATPVLKERFEAFDELLESFDSHIGFLDSDYESRERAVRICEERILSYADKLEKNVCGERSLKAILGGYFNEHDTPKLIIERYFQFLELVPELSAKHDGNPAGFLKEAMGIILGFEEGNYLRSANPRLLYIADIAPDFLDSRLVPAYMDELYRFLHMSQHPTWMKVLLGCYYVTYIKPFDMSKDKDHNLLLAAVLGRYILSEEGFDLCSSYLPIEAMLLFDENFIKSEDKEIRKTGDVTYFLSHALSVLTPLVTKLLDDFQKETASAIGREAIEIPQEEIDQIRPGEPEEKPEKEEEKPVPIEEKPAPSKPIVEAVDANEYETPTDTGEVALPTPKRGSGDKEAKERAKYVLETHPMLRKSHANFYASHCTIGRYYTIQDFKKATRCAYETARTSMDLLAAEGFYKKLKVKNKFVYTPVKIKQGE